MAKGGKKSSAKKRAAKRLTSPLPPESAKWFAKVKAETKDYWAKNPPADWTSRSITRWLARERVPRAQSERLVPQVKTTIGATVLEAMDNHPRGRKEGARSYARRLQRCDPRLASEKLVTITRRLYD